MAIPLRTRGKLDFEVFLSSYGQLNIGFFRSLRQINQSQSWSFLLYFMDYKKHGIMTTDPLAMKLILRYAWSQLLILWNHIYHPHLPIISKIQDLLAQDCNVSLHHTLRGQTFVQIGLQNMGPTMLILLLLGYTLLRNYFPFYLPI